MSAWFVGWQYKCHLHLWRWISRLTLQTYLWLFLLLLYLDELSTSFDGSITGISPICPSPFHLCAWIPKDNLPAFHLSFQIVSPTPFYYKINFLETILTKLSTSSGNHNDSQLPTASNRNFPADRSQIGSTDWEIHYIHLLLTVTRSSPLSSS